MLNRRNAFVAFVGAAALPAMASCSGANTIPVNLQALITAVQQGVAKACGFLPSVEGVLALIGGLNPVISGVEAAVSAICAALSTPPLTYATPRVGAPGQVVVKGVVVTGIFVR